MDKLLINSSILTFKVKYREYIVLNRDSVKEMYLVSNIAYFYLMNVNKTNLYTNI